MGLLNILGFGGTGGTSTGAVTVKSIYRFGMLCNDFVTFDIFATYSKILTDVVERTQGLSDEQLRTFWDSAVKSEASEGLVTMLAKAMMKKSDLYIVYSSATGVVREATASEQQQIREDYAKQASSKVGTFVSFKNFKRTDMLQVYSELEYNALASMHKTMNISKAVQIKTKDLRKSVSVVDATLAIDQARDMAEGLRDGDDIILDADDEIATTTPDTSAIEKSVQFLDAKRAWILGMPIAYISGLQTGGIGSTGEADTRAAERGFKQYFVSIIKPVADSLFGTNVTFKSQDVRQISTALEVLKAFDLVSDTDLLSRESMQQILARMFDIDITKEKKLIEKEQAADGGGQQQTTAAPTGPVRSNTPGLAGGRVN